MEHEISEQEMEGRAFTGAGKPRTNGKAPTIAPGAQTVLEEAAAIIDGPRRESYGSVQESFGRVARTWSDLLKVQVTPQQVALCMVALKLHREANKHSRDNIVDICGYAALLDRLYEKPS